MDAAGQQLSRRHLVGRRRPCWSNRRLTRQDLRLQPEHEGAGREQGLRYPGRSGQQRDGPIGIWSGRGHDHVGNRRLTIDKIYAYNLPPRRGWSSACGIRGRHYHQPGLRRGPRRRSFIAGGLSLRGDRGDSVGGGSLRRGVPRHRRRHGAPDHGRRHHRGRAGQSVVYTAPATGGLQGTVGRRRCKLSPGRL